MPDTYLLPIEAALYLRVAPKTLTKWRGQGKGPPYRKVAGTLIRYVQSELEEWMQAQAVMPGDRRATRHNRPRRGLRCTRCHPGGGRRGRNTEERRMTEAQMHIFVGLVADMRAWQIRYARSRSQEALLRAKEFEVLVDNALTGLLHPESPQEDTR